MHSEMAEDIPHVHDKRIGVAPIVSGDPMLPAVLQKLKDGGSNFVQIMQNIFNIADQCIPK
jgi:hypothetical protein